MTKVLYFVDRLRHGGIQQLILEILKHYDRENMQIDLLIFNDGETYPLEEEIRKLGINIYKIDGWIKTPLSYITQKKVLDKFYKEHHDYKVVHLHSSSKNFLVLKEAKKYGIPMRIAHSHNIGFQTKNKAKILIGNILKNELIKNATDYFACSRLAGEWLFGKKQEIKIIHNAIDYERFKFNNDIRIETRKKLKFSDEDIVIGHVGRFTNQKNHNFLIDIFYELYLKNKNYKLLLVGIGEKENEIKNKIKTLGIQENVLFIGFCDEVNKIMQAMDIFVFPSLYEGLGLVLIEAQASGLPCITSKYVVPSEVKINENFKFLELNNNPKEWANEIMNIPIKRKSIDNEIIEAGYLIDDMVKKLQQYYLKQKERK